MLLSKILEGIEILGISGNTDIEISDIAYDSRKANKDNIFVCLSGANIDGHKFINKAIENGVSAVVVENDVNVKNCTVIKVKNTREALSKLSSNFFDDPASKLGTIGITGTKGKTTTSFMIKSILEKSGQKVGMIGTIGIVIGDKIIKTENTTPESYEVQKYMNEMVESGCKWVVIEASSLGLKHHRLDGFTFDYGVFTNFSEDHIGTNEHESMEEYLECKSMLFRKCKIGIINIDDKSFEKILINHTCKVKTYGFSENSDLIASNVGLISKPGYIGVKFDVTGELNLSVNVPIPGKFSVYNALAAITVCKYIGIKPQDILDGINEVRVKGRVEPVKINKDFTLLIDYAHNALSMENILTTLKEYNPTRLITMFGAGGNRAKARRYEMGEISGKLSDLSVITADNSRYENVMDIIDDIKVGLDKTNGKYIVIPDRKEAIKYCIQNAKQGDIVVLAGKGHEDYQEINGKKYPFDERVIVNEIISEIN